MRYSLMQDIMAGKLDEHLNIQLMLLEEDVAETMGSLQAHFKTYRLPGFEVTHAGVVQQMFMGQALMRQLLAEPTLACPLCKGEQEIVRLAGTLPGMKLQVVLACTHIAAITPRPAPSGAVQ